MLQSTLIFLLLGLLLLAINLRHKRHIEGLVVGLRMMLAVLPVILVAFLLAGMIEAAIPEEFVRRWLAPEAGLRGVLLGTFGGMLLAMGPYASFPIIASIHSAGAGLGTVVALITAWTLLGLNKLPYEIGFLGPRFAALRVALSLPCCIGAGALAHLVQTVLMG